MSTHGAAIRHWNIDAVHKWDEAIAQALGIDVETIFEYAELLASEPAVSATSWARTLTGLNRENHS